MWVDENKGSYRIRDRVAGRIITLAMGFPTKTAAKEQLRILAGDKARGDALVPRGGRATLEEFVADWWPHYERGLKPTSRHSEGGRVRNHIVALLGHIALEDIDTALINDWIDQLQRGIGPMGDGKRKRRPLSPKTIASCHGMLFVIMRAAIVARLIRVNPCSGSTLPARLNREMRFLTDPEITRLVEHTPARWRPLVMLLVGTGLRWGEAIALKVGRVDLLAARPKLRVEEHLHELSGAGELVLTSPKSTHSRRTVSFTLQVALALTPLVAGKAAADLIFTAPMGGPVRTRHFRRGWLKWTTAAGLEGLRVHDLRHTHASVLIAANRQLSAISRRLGHSSSAITDTLYGHLREEVDEGILDAISLSMAGIPADAMDAEVSAEIDNELDYAEEQRRSSGSETARSNPERPGGNRRSRVIRPRNRRA